MRYWLCRDVLSYILSSGSNFPCCFWAVLAEMCIEIILRGNKMCSHWVFIWSCIMFLLGSTVLQILVQWFLMWFYSVLAIVHMCFDLKDKNNCIGKHLCMPQLTVLHRPPVGSTSLYRINLLGEQRCMLWTDDNLNLLHISQRKYLSK